MRAKSLFLRGLQLYYLFCRHTLVRKHTCVDGYISEILVEGVSRLSAQFVIFISCNMSFFASFFLSSSDSLGLQCPQVLPWANPPTPDKSLQHLFWFDLLGLAEFV